MKYDVHLFVVGRIKVEGVEANSPQEAYAKAEDVTDPTDFLHADGDATKRAIWDEGPSLGGLIDVCGDEDYGQTEYVQGEGASGYLSIINQVKLHN